MPRLPKPAPPAAELSTAYATAGLIPLSRRYGVAQDTVRAWLVAAGIEVRARCQHPELLRPGKLTAAERDALQATNLTSKLLAERAGVSWQAINRALRGEVSAVRVLVALRSLLPLCS